MTTVAGLVFTGLRQEGILTFVHHYYITVYQWTLQIVEGKWNWNWRTGLDSNCFIHSLIHYFVNPCIFTFYYYFRTAEWLQMMMDFNFTLETYIVTVFMCYYHLA